MQVSVESGEGLTRRMTVGLPSDRFEAEVEKRLREIARKVRLPGFRPGKVPVKVLRQRFGGQVQQEVLGDLVKSSFSEAVAQERLRPVGAPHIEPEIDTGERRYGYTAEFEVLPAIELAPVGGKSVKRPTAEVTEADLDDMIERLRTQRKTWAEVERPAQEGDRVTISFTGTLDGEPFEGGSAENLDLELGNGRMIPGFESGLIGAAPGEERRLELSFPQAYHTERLRGRPVVFEVRVARVQEPVLPEVDADFAKAFGIEDGDLARLRQDVRRNMERELRQRISNRVKNQVMDLLLEANPIDLPAVLVKEEISALREQMRQNAGGASLELPDSLFEGSARRRVALGLIIAEVVKANQIQVDPARVRAAVEDLASTYEDPQEVIDYYMTSRERRSSVETLALEDQVVDWVMSQVTVDEEPLSFRQLTDPTSRA